MAAWMERGGRDASESAISDTGDEVLPEIWPFKYLYSLLLPISRLLDGRLAPSLNLWSYTHPIDAFLAVNWQQTILQNKGSQGHSQALRLSWQREYFTLLIKAIHQAAIEKAMSQFRNVLLVFPLVKKKSSSFWSFTSNLLGNQPLKIFNGS